MEGLSRRNEWLGLRYDPINRVTFASFTACSMGPALVVGSSRSGVEHSQQCALYLILCVGSPPFYRRGRKAGSLNLQSEDREGERKEEGGRDNRQE